MHLEPHDYDVISRHQETKGESSHNQPLPKYYNVPVTKLSQSESSETSHGLKLSLGALKTNQGSGYVNVGVNFQNPEQDDDYVVVNSHPTVTDSRSQDMQRNVNTTYLGSYSTLNSGELNMGGAGEQDSYEYIGRPAGLPEVQTSSTNMYSYVPTVVRVGTRKMAVENRAKHNALPAIIDDGEYI